MPRMGRLCQRNSDETEAMKGGRAEGGTGEVASGKSYISLGKRPASRPPFAKVLHETLGDWTVGWGEARTPTPSTAEALGFTIERSPQPTHRNRLPSRPPLCEGGTGGFIFGLTDFPLVSLYWRRRLRSPSPALPLRERVKDTEKGLLSCRQKAEAVASLYASPLITFRISGGSSGTSVWVPPSMSFKGASCRLSSSSPRMRVNLDLNLSARRIWLLRLFPS
jgi:hypothetical protein